MTIYTQKLKFKGHTHACTHAHMHAHHFTALFDFVRDYPGELAPER